MSKEILLPREGESVAIAINKPKTASLCYDRIWAPLNLLSGQGEIVPNSIRCFGESPIELDIVRMKNRIFKKDEITRVSKDELDITWAELMTYKSLTDSISNRLNLGDDTYIDIDSRVFDKLIFREIAKSFTIKHGITMIPIYGSRAERNRQYVEGDRETIFWVLSNLKIVEEDQLTWEKVLEFRADKENQKKYKRFLHWLDSEMIERSQAYVEDEIAIRLEDYEKALKKHGIKTIVGMIEEALDGKYLLGASGVAGSLTLAGHPALGMLAEGLLIGGKIGAKLVQAKLDFDDVERGPNYEISWVYEVKKLDK